MLSSEIGLPGERQDARQRPYRGFAAGTLAVLLAMGLGGNAKASPVQPVAQGSIVLTAAEKPVSTSEEPVGVVALALARECIELTPEGDLNQSGSEQTGLVTTGRAPDGNECQFTQQSGRVVRVYTDLAPDGITNDLRLIDSRSLPSGGDEKVWDYTTAFPGGYHGRNFTLDGTIIGKGGRQVFAQICLPGYDPNSPWNWPCGAVDVLGQPARPGNPAEFADFLQSMSQALADMPSDQNAGDRIKA